MHASPRVRDPEATRGAVLEAAESLFADRGFAATSMRDLALAAGVSQALIHHHFGSKRALYEAVKRRVTDRYHRHGAPGPEPGPAGLAAELARFHGFLDRNQTLLRLAAWSRLEGDLSPWPGEAELISALCQRVRQDQRRGLLRRDLEPMNLVILLIAVVYYWIENRDYYRASLGDEAVDDRSYLRDAIGLIVQGVAPATSRAD